MCSCGWSTDILIFRLYSMHNIENMLVEFGQDNFKYLDILFIFLPYCPSLYILHYSGVLPFYIGVQKHSAECSVHYNNPTMHHNKYKKMHRSKYVLHTYYNTLPCLVPNKTICAQFLWGRHSDYICLCDPLCCHTVMTSHT